MFINSSSVERMNFAYVLSNTQRVNILNVLIDMFLIMLYLRPFLFNHLSTAPKSSTLGGEPCKIISWSCNIIIIFNKCFLFPVEEVPKGIDKYIKEIQPFQRYFETVYDSNDLSRTIHEATITLKEKMMAKLPNLKIPHYMED